jgi:hypothetical protein
MDPRFRGDDVGEVSGEGLAIPYMSNLFTSTPRAW